MFLPCVVVPAPEAVLLVLGSGATEVVLLVMRPTPSVSRSDWSCKFTQVWTKVSFSNSFRSGRYSPMRPLTLLTVKPCTWETKWTVDLFSYNQLFGHNRFLFRRQTYLKSLINSTGSFSCEDKAEVISLSWEVNVSVRSKTLVLNVAQIKPGFILFYIVIFLTCLFFDTHTSHILV